MTGLSHHDDDLLATYALDAVDAAEAEVIDIHLRDCGRCRAIVGEFRATASHLAAGREPPPPDLWHAIATRLEADAPRDAHVGSSITLRLRALVVAVAAAITLIGGLGAGVVTQGRRIDGMQAALEDRTVLAAALAAEAHPDARRVELRSGDGELLGHAVVTPAGAGFLRASSLGALSPDRTYQLWAVVATERISLGLLGPRPEVVPFHAAGVIIGLAVTEELAGGVVASQNPPVATGLLVNV